MRQRHLKGDGSCACGCGGVPTRYTQQHIADEIQPGDFRRFIAGHSSRRPDDPRNAGPDYIEEDRGYKTPCHIWQRSLTPKGYAQSPGSGREHVVRWVKKFGPVPPGKQLDHLCRVCPCVNEDHLEAVFPAINIRRSRVAKLAQEQIDEIRSRAHSTTQAALAREFGIHPSAISRIVNHKRWKDVV